MSHQVRFFLCHGDEGEPCLLGPHPSSVLAGRMDSLTWGGSCRLDSSEVTGRLRAPFTFPGKGRVGKWRQDQEWEVGVWVEAEALLSQMRGRTISGLFLYSQRSDIQALPQADF